MDLSYLVNITKDYGIKVKIHLMSDTHIEGKKGHFPMPMVCGDVCVLAGDIGVAARASELEEYFDQLYTQFNHIIYVLGNHEFYHMDYEGALSIMSNICSKHDVHLMDMEYQTDNLILDGVTFWASTLWTDLNGYKAADFVGYGLSDYSVIKGFSTEQSYAIHNKTVPRINWDADVVITHHNPLFRKHSRHDLSEIIYGFCSTKLEKLIEESNIKYWFYGHTHDNVVHELNKTIVATNQVGYGNEQMTNPYDPYFLIEV